MSEPPTKQRPLTHWFNPWREAVPVPIERLAECCADNPAEQAQVLERWRMSGERLDAYVLPNGIVSGHFSIGVRYGSHPEDYLSPYASRPAVAQALLEEFGR